VGTGEYRRALSVAEKELSRLNVEANVIALRQAQLQQTISTLKTLTNVSEEGERTLTDVIRIIVKAASGYISAAGSDVLWKKSEGFHHHDSGPFGKGRRVGEGARNNKGAVSFEGTCPSLTWSD
jgi:hypothetical protein